MAVEDKFTNALVASGKKTQSRYSSGTKMLCLPFNFEVAAADTDLSVYRLGRLSANAVPVKCLVYADAALGTSEWDLGLYKPGVGGAVVDRDLFLDGQDLTAGVAITIDANNGLTNLGGADPVGDFGQTLWELLGLSAPGRQDYDLAFTGVVTGGAAGTISGFFWYLID